MTRNGRLKRNGSPLLTGLLAAVLMFPVLPAGGAAWGAAADDGCLAVAGSGSVPVTQVLQNQDVTIHYTLTPQGTHTTSSGREAVDVAFVADVSGSMAFHMTSSNSSPIRMDVLKQASQTLTNKFASAHAGDRLGLIKFSSSAAKVKDLTTDYAQIQSSINGFQAGGGTNIDDALNAASAMLTASGTKPEKYAILLTDGKATQYTDSRGKVQDGETAAAQEARKDADALAQKGIKVYTIALAEAGSQDVDLDLLRYIAAKTGGMMYQASSVEQLAAAFDNITTVMVTPAKLSGVVLRQPIPDGFVLAPEGNAPNVSYDSSAKEIVISIGDIAYPFAQAQYSFDVHLIPATAAGNYPLADATVTYQNACGANQQFNISLGATLSVGIRVVDKYGNVYLGNSQGEVQRMRTGDQALQWTIHEFDSAVTGIQFEDTDHTVVIVHYQNGQTSRWDLKPTAPAELTAKDANGTAIADDKWHPGPVTIVSVSGSASQLPASTVYANNDFTDKFIAGYQYGISDGAWQAFNASSPAAVPDGSNVGLRARAFTNAISGSAAIPIYGAEINRTVSPDSTGPDIGWELTILHSPDDDKPYDAKIVIKASDNLSPVTGIKVWLDGSQTVSKEADASRLVKNGDTYSFTFNLSDVNGYGSRDSRLGWHQIVYEATSEGGTTKSSPDYFVINPGPSAALVPDNYTSGSYADKPVTVHVKDLKLPVADRTFGGVLKKGFTLSGMYYSIKSDAGQPADSDWKPLAATTFTVTTRAGAVSGKYEVYLKLKDSEGVANVFGPLNIQFDTEQNRY
jgi:Mg-chelatase subunit ChlD